MKFRDVCWSVGLFVFFSILYSFTKNQLFSFDALTNALACEASQPIRWFHPNHLMYPFIGALWYKIELVCGYHGYAIYSLARLNAILVAAGLVLLFQTFRQDRSQWAALSLTFFLGFCFAVWHYAGDGRAIGTVVFFAGLLLFTLRQWNDREQLNLSQLILLALLSSLYIFSHAIGIFHVIAVALWLQHFSLKGKKGHAPLFYLGLTTLILLVAYEIVYFTLINTPNGPPFFRWAVGYAGTTMDESVVLSRFWVKNVPQGIGGLWWGWCHAFFNPLPTQAMGTFVSASIGLLFLAGFVYLLRQRASLDKPRQRYLSLCFLWGLLCLVFLGIWSPGQEGFRLHVLIPWVAAVAVLVSQETIFLRCVSSAAALVFVLNFGGPIYFNASIKNNQVYQLLKELRSHLQPGDVLISGNSLPEMEVLMPYFFPEIRGGTLSGRLYTYNERSLEPLNLRLQAQIHDGHGLYLTEDVFDPGFQKQIENHFSLEDGEVQKFLAHYVVAEQFPLSSAHQITKMTVRN